MSSWLAIAACGGAAAFLRPGAVPRGWWAGLVVGVGCGVLLEWHHALRDYVAWAHGEYYLVEGRTGALVAVLGASAILHGLAGALIGWTVEVAHDGR